VSKIDRFLKTHYYWRQQVKHKDDGVKPQQQHQLQ
jgi:hypothetical protein